MANFCIISKELKKNGKINIKIQIKVNDYISINLYTTKLTLDSNIY